MNSRKVTLKKTKTPNQTRDFGVFQKKLLLKLTYLTIIFLVI